MSVSYYPAVVDRAGDGFGVTFPDLPGCIAYGDTVASACINAELSLNLHLHGMAKDHDNIPNPSLPPPMPGDVVAVVMVRADVPTQTERVLISISKSLLAAVDTVSTNRSAFMSEAARELLKSRLTN